MTLVARRRGFDSRAAIGLVPPRSISRNVDSARGGAAFHYVGSTVSVANHNACRQAWKNIQAYHMSPGALGTTNGASDIGYNAGVCPHGIVLAGRGWGVRSAANGTNDSNYRYLAVCALIGAGQTPTLEMREAMAWVAWEWRRLGAGREVRPHSNFTSTACPGNPIRNDAGTLHNKNIATPTTTNEDDDMSWSKWTSAERNAMLDAVAERVAKRPNPTNNVSLGAMIRRNYNRVEATGTRVRELVSAATRIEGEVAGLTVLVTSLATANNVQLSEDAVSQLAAAVVEAGNQAGSAVLARIEAMGQAAQGELGE